MTANVSDGKRVVQVILTARSAETGWVEVKSYAGGVPGRAPRAVRSQGYNLRETRWAAKMKAALSLDEMAEALRVMTQMALLP